MGWTREWVCEGLSCLSVVLFCCLSCCFFVCLFIHIIHYHFYFLFLLFFFCLKGKGKVSRFSKYLFWAHAAAVPVHRVGWGVLYNYSYSWTLEPPACGESFSLEINIETRSETYVWSSLLDMQSCAFSVYIWRLLAVLRRRLWSSGTVGPLERSSRLRERRGELYISIIVVVSGVVCSWKRVWRPSWVTRSTPTPTSPSLHPSSSLLNHHHFPLPRHVE